MFFWFLMYFFGLFWIRSVCFGCFETGPKHRNIPKIFLWVLWNKPKMNRNRLSFVCFGSNREKKFVCFEDTLQSRV
jgi:hypothetical protein